MDEKITLFKRMMVEQFGEPILDIPMEITVGEKSEDIPIATWGSNKLSQMRYANGSREWMINDVRFMRYRRGQNTEQNRAVLLSKTTM